jgi:NADPH:quinone reductase-like Zn-dependent oxidoreductase
MMTKLFVIRWPALLPFKIRFMKTLRFHSFGSPEVLVIEEMAQPVPGAGEVLIQIKAAGINPSDVVNVAGRFKATTLPRVPGRDFAGVTVPGGQRVWGSVTDFGITRDGSHAEYAVAPEEAIAIAPSNLSAEEAAAVGVPFTTAWAALIRCAQLQAGETVLVTGAAGAVGQAATQIANWKGARVLGATLGGSAAAGAAAVVDTTGDMRARVLELTYGKGAEVVFDTVGGALFEPALRCLSRGGRQVAISSSKEPRVSFSLVDFYHNLSRLIGFDSYGFKPRDTVEILDELRGGFESGLLHAPQVKAVPFGDAVGAYQDVAGGRATAKLVLITA